MPPGSPIEKFDDLAEGQRIGVVQGTVEESYVVDTLQLQPVKYPDFVTVYAALKTRQLDAWVAPALQAQTVMRSGDPATTVANTFSLGSTSWPTRLPKTTRRLIDALNSALDEVIAGRHLDEAVHRVGSAVPATGLEARVAGRS